MAQGYAYNKSPQPVTDNSESLTVDGTVTVGSITNTVNVNVATASFVAGTGSTAPLSAALAGFKDASNVMQSVRAYDIDTGAGVEYVPGVNLRKASGTATGSVEFGTSADPIRTDPVGTTAQPVTDNGSSLTVDGAVTISNTVIVNVATASFVAGTGSASPLSAALVGFKDASSVMQSARVYDVDTGSGVEYVVGLNLRKASGTATGSVEFGTNVDPVRTDPVGTTAQPVTDNGSSLTVDGAVTIASSVAVTGTIAHGAAIGTTNPVIISGRASDTEQTDVAQNQVTHVWLDLKGRLVTVGDMPPAARSGDTTGPKSVVVTSSTNQVLLASPGAGQSLTITQISVGGTGSILTFANIIEGGTAGSSDGTQVWSMPVASGGGGWVQNFQPAYKLPANTGLTSRLSVVGTTASFNLQYYVAP